MKRTTSESYFEQRMYSLLTQAAVESASHRAANKRAGRAVYSEHPSRATRRALEAAQRRLRKMQKGKKS